MTKEKLTSEEASTIRARALEEAAKLTENFPGSYAAANKIRALISTPPAPAPLTRTQAAVKRMAEGDDAKMPEGARRPPAPAPDEAAIRAELVAALRGVMALVQGPQHVMKKPVYAELYPVMERARAALAKAAP